MKKTIFHNHISDPQWSKKPVRYTAANSLGFALSAAAGKSHHLDKVIIVTGDACEEAVALAANDLADYFQKTCDTVTVALKKAGSLSADDYKNANLIMIGNGRDNAAIASIRTKMKLPAVLSFPDKYREMTGITMNSPGSGFSVTTIPNPYHAKKAVILLEGTDRLGAQYAVYDWAEEVLGVRYYSPYFDYLPRWDSIIAPELNYREETDFAVRRLEVWNFSSMHEALWDPIKKRVRPDLKLCTDFSQKNNDPSRWYENGLLGDAAMMKKVIDWLVKNKQNTITWLHEHFFHLPPITPLEYSRYEVMRGVKIMGIVSPGSNHLPEAFFRSPDPTFRKNSCQSKDGESFTHLCYKTKAYWDKLEEEIAWYDLPENRIRQTIAFSLYYGEGSCAYPAYCISDRPLMRCFRCGTIPSWKKWTHTMKVCEEILKARGRNVPVGLIDFGCGSSGVPDGYDKRFGCRPELDKKVIDHAPSKNNYFELRPAGDHTCEEMGYYWGMVAKRNRKEKLHLSIFKEGESLLMMSSDLPLVSPYYFKTRDHDFARLAGDPVTWGHDTNIYTTRQLEWLKQYHAFSGQWKYEKPWKKFLSDEVNHLFGKGTGEEFSEVCDLLSRTMEQELIWKKTPYNRDVKTFRGIQTHFPYLKYIFLNLTRYPITLMNLRRKDGGLWNLEDGGANIYTRSRITKRDYHGFVMGEYKITLSEAGHYLGLLDSCEHHLAGMERKMTRNGFFYRKEFRYYINGAILFLRWRLKAVSAYCHLLDGFHAALVADRKKTAVSFQKSLSDMEGAIKGLKRYWDEYGLEQEPVSWGESTPAVEYLEGFLKEWKRIVIKDDKNTWVSWCSIMRAYIYGADTFPELFTGKLKGVDCGNLDDRERWIHKDGKIVRCLRDDVVAVPTSGQIGS